MNRSLRFRTCSALLVSSLSLALSPPALAQFPFKFTLGRQNPKAAEPSGNSVLQPVQERNSRPVASTSSDPFVEMRKAFPQEPRLGMLGTRSKVSQTPKVEEKPRLAEALPAAATSQGPTVSSAEQISSPQQVSPLAQLALPQTPTMAQNDGGSDVQLRGIDPNSPPSGNSNVASPPSAPPSASAAPPAGSTLPSASQPAPAASNSTQAIQENAPPADLSPVTVKSAEMLGRYLTHIARRHGIQPPAPTDITRAQLGQYFLKMMPQLANVPADQLSRQDLNDIGMLTDEFEDALWQVKGTMALRAFKAPLAESEAMSKKMADAQSRLQALEKLKINGDFTFVPQSDMGRGDRDSMTANLRARINFLARVHEAKAEDRLGDGYLFARLTAAAGRFFPRNKYLLSPFNDVVDANASPFNSGPNEVQTSSLFINNNNSNSLRPTVSLEQAYYSQDVRLTNKLKGNYKAGLIYLGAMFDNNNFANNESLQFLSTQFVNSISWRPNFNGPAFVASVERPILRGKAFVRATSGIATISNRDVFGSYGFNYEAQFGHTFFNKEGNLRAGFWNWNFRRGTQTPFTTPIDLSGTGLLSLVPGGTAQDGPKPVGMYANFDQRIWKNIGIFGRYAMNDRSIGEVFLGGLLSSRQSWSFGSEVPIKSFYPKRTDDVLGIAYGHIYGYSRGNVISPATPAFLGINGNVPTDLEGVNANLALMSPGARFRRPEKTLEVYYRYQLNKNVSISPDFQYIWHPGGTAPQPGIIVLSTRLNVVF